MYLDRLRIREGVETRNLLDTSKKHKQRPLSEGILKKFLLFSSLFGWKRFSSRLVSFDTFTDRCVFLQKLYSRLSMKNMIS